MDWQEIYGGWVLIPDRQAIGIVHFLGGAFVATAPQLTYRWLLEELAKAGYVTIATPFINTFDHVAIAREVLNRFETILERLQDNNALGKRYLPIYGMGHSMGCKLHLLIGGLFAVERAGNILISFNNYPVKRAIPFIEQLEIDTVFNLEFTPSPTETDEIIASSYKVRRNLLIEFNNDDLDQTFGLDRILKTRFPNMIARLELPGNHLTPLSQNLNWETGQVFTPFDAIGQWFKQEFSRDLQRLKQEILRWLNPVGIRG
ncbi:MAG: DUF1350 family protein [Xenococcaceae cyanobacterium]